MKNLFNHDSYLKPNNDFDTVTYGLKLCLDSHQWNSPC